MASLLLALTYQTIKQLCTHPAMVEEIFLKGFPGFDLSTFIDDVWFFFVSTAFIVLCAVKLPIFIKQQGMTKIYSKPFFDPLYVPLIF